MLNRIFSVLSSVAGAAHQLDVCRPIAAPLGERDDVVNLITLLDGFSAASALTFLLLKDARNVIFSKKSGGIQNPGTAAMFACSVPSSMLFVVIARPFQ